MGQKLHSLQLSVSTESDHGKGQGFGTLCWLFRHAWWSRSLNSLVHQRMATRLTELRKTNLYIPVSTFLYLRDQDIWKLVVDDESIGSGIETNIRLVWLTSYDIKIFYLDTRRPRGVDDSLQPLTKEYE